MSLKNVAVSSCLGLIASIAMWSACGPSIRRTYQSDNAFEHCFDQDFDSQTTDAVKSACWGDWLANYVYNQPDDKIRYAEMRRVEIAQGISIPGPPGTPGQFFKRPRLLVDASVQKRGTTRMDAGTDGGAQRIITSTEE